MAEALCVVLACLFSLMGFALMALGQERHWQHVIALEPDARIGQAILFRIGLGAQGVALPLMIYAEGPGFGALLWGVSLTAMAMLVAFVLSWRPRWLVPLAKIVRTRR